MVLQPTSLRINIRIIENRLWKGENRSLPVFRPSFQSKLGWSNTPCVSSLLRCIVGLLAITVRQYLIFWGFTSSQCTTISMSWLSTRRQRTQRLWKAQITGPGFCELGWKSVLGCPITIVVFVGVVISTSLSVLIAI
jgi:hypothetical protein